MIEVFEKEFIERSSVTWEHSHAIKDNVIANIDKQKAKIAKWYDKLLEGLVLEK